MAEIWIIIKDPPRVRDGQGCGCSNPKAPVVISSRIRGVLKSKLLKCPNCQKRWQRIETP